MSDLNIVHLNLNYTPNYNKNRAKVIMQNKLIKKLARHIKNGTQNEFNCNNDSIKKDVNKSVNESIESSNKNSYEYSINNILENKNKLFILNPNKNQIKKLRKSLSLLEDGKLFRKNYKKYLDNKQHVNKLLLPKLDNINSFDLISKNLNAHADNYNVDNFNNDMRNFDEQYETIKVANENSKIMIRLTKDLGRKSFLKKCKECKENINNNNDFRYIMKYPHNSVRNLINSNYNSMSLNNLNNINSNKIRYHSFNKLILENKSYERLFSREKSNNIELSTSERLEYYTFGNQKMKNANYNSLIEQILNSSKEIRKISKKISLEMNIENIKLPNEQV